MSYARCVILTCVLLILSEGCKREVSTSASQPSGSPVALPATQPSDSDKWAKIIVGSWVSSPIPPLGGSEDNCATDANFDFEADGGYSTSSDEGRWSVSGNTLVATIIASNPDGDIGPPMKKLAKPIVIRTSLVSYKEPILAAIGDGEKEYWYHCPQGTDANP